jgi:co-chaperonin GroES (HSP10)|tara:strand:+ start:423 stop:833 length:411 start_codon:yes stop_codon:yes gene_type:complete
MMNKLLVPQHVLDTKRKLKEKKELEKIPQPTGFRLVILPLMLKKKTEAGLHLTDETIEQAQITTNICKILKVGSDAYKDKERFPNGPWCKEGDWVIIAKYAGSRITIEGGELRIINDDEILATIDDPRDILPATLI